jgi:hypothetical protein
MKKMTILLFSLCFANLMFPQQASIKITNQTSDKEIVIKENKRIKIKTTDGKKISGRFQIEDENTILIKNERINFADIAEIKRNPLLVSILTSTTLIYLGAVTVGIGAIIGVFGESSGFLLAIPGAALIYAGIKAPNFNRKFKNNGSKWSFEIITASK